MSEPCVKISPMANKSKETAGFVGEVKNELKKVTWPTRKETVRLTIVVIFISLIVALYLGIIDVLLAKLLEVLTKTR